MKKSELKQLIKEEIDFLQGRPEREFNWEDLEREFYKEHVRVHNFGEEWESNPGDVFDWFKQILS